jgi:hypothetical protein
MNVIRRLLWPCLAAAACLAAAGGASAATDRAAAVGSAAAAPTIPATTVKFAYYPCCADTSVPLVGIRQGFFKQVGISISPSDGFQWSQPSQFLPAMQRGEFDVATAFSTTWLSTLNSFGMNLPPTMLYDVYLGRDILVAPNSPLKTAVDYVKSGMKFPQAAAKAVTAIKGKTIFTDPFAGAQPPYYDVLLSYGNMTSKDISFTFLADDKILALSATPGRMELAFPLAAPVLVAMLRGGWRPLIDMGSILKYDGASSQAKELMSETGNQTVMMQRSFLEKKHDTALRFISAVFRTIHFLQDPKTGLAGDKIVADTINAAQGLKLIPADIATVYKDVDPLFSWEQQGQTVWNPSSPFYAPKGYQVAVQALIANKTLPQGTYDLKRFLAARDVYSELRADQKQADTLFKQAAKAKKVDKVLLAKAKRYYQWYDFLDAARFAKAALGKR